MLLYLSANHAALNVWLSSCVRHACPGLGSSSLIASAGFLVASFQTRILMHRPCICISYALCYTETAPNDRHCRGTPKTGKTYNQPICPSTGITHKPSTRHYLNGSPGVRTHNTTQHSSRARLQHRNHPPSPTPNRVTTSQILPANVAHSEAQAG